MSDEHGMPIINGVDAEEKLLCACMRRLYLLLQHRKSMSF